MKTTRLVSLVFAFCATAHIAQDAAADIQGFGDFSQFAYNHSDNGSPPTVSPGIITITDGGGQEGRSLFYNTPQNITSFTVSFRYQIPSGSATVFDFDPSAAFVIQNSPQGVHAVGSGGETFAYSGITNSAAVSLQLGGNGATGSSGTGLFTGGIVSTAMSTSPVLLTLGHPVDVVLSYNGSTLTETLRDTVTSTEFSKSYLTNLVNAIGGNTAYVGFTAATDNSGFQPPQSQTLSNFHFANVPEPGSFFLAALALLALVGFRLRRTA